MNCKMGLVSLSLIFACNSWAIEKIVCEGKGQRNWPCGGYVNHVVTLDVNEFNAEEAGVAEIKGIYQYTQDYFTCYPDVTQSQGNFTGTIKPRNWFGGGIHIDLVSDNETFIYAKLHILEQSSRGTLVFGDASTIGLTCKVSE